MVLVSLSLAVVVALGPPATSSQPVRVPNEKPSWFHGLDAPEATFALDLDVDHEDTVPPPKVVRMCAAYASHAVLWTENSWLIGEQDVAVRARPGGWTAERICAVTAEGAKERSFSNADTFDPVGAVGRYLFTVYSDGAGVLSSFQVIDMETGRHVIEDEFNLDKGVVVASGSKGQTVSWWSSIGEPPCLPRRGESECWQRILKARKVPKTVQIPQPDCEAIVMRNPSHATDPVGIQVTIHVRAALGGSGPEYLGDAATCDEAP